MEKEVPQDKWFYLHKGGVLKNLQELALALSTMDDEVFYHHVHSGKNDFANWIRDVFHERKLANHLYALQSKQETAREIENHLAAFLPVQEKMARQEIAMAIKQIKAGVQPRVAKSINAVKRAAVRVVKADPSKNKKQVPKKFKTRSKKPKKAIKTIKKTNRKKTNRKKTNRKKRIKKPVTRIKKIAKKEARKKAKTKKTRKSRMQNIKTIKKKTAKRKSKAKRKPINTKKSGINKKGKTKRVRAKNRKPKVIKSSKKKYKKEADVMEVTIAKEEAQEVVPPRIESSGEDKHMASLVMKDIRSGLLYVVIIIFLAYVIYLLRG